MKMDINSHFVTVASLARALVLDWLRSKTGVFFTILFPIMLMVILTLAFNDDLNRLDLYVQNLDLDRDGMPTETSSSLINALSSSMLNIKHIPTDVDAYEYVKYSTSKRVLIIPYGFDASIKAKSMEARMAVMLSTLDLFTEQSWMQDGVRASMISGMEGLKRELTIRNGDNNGDNASNTAPPPAPARLLLIVDSSKDREYERVEGILASMVARLQQSAIDAPDILRMEVKDVSITERANYYLPSVLAAFIMTNGVLGTSGIVADFKRRGMLKRLMSTPLSRLQWIIANMMTQTILALILASVMVCIAVIALNTTLPNAISIVVLTIGALCFTGLGMLIAGALKEPHAITGASNAIAFPMMFLSGTFWPIGSMPEYMQSIAYALPLTYFVDALNASMYQSSILALQSTSMLALFTIAFVILGSYLTRWKQE